MSLLETQNTKAIFRGHCFPHAVFTADTGVFMQKGDKRIETEVRGGCKEKKKDTFQWIPLLFNAASNIGRMICPECLS